MYNNPENSSVIKADLERDSIEYISNIYKTYEKIKDSYLAQELTQQNQFLLILMTKNTKIPFEVKQLPLLRYFIETCQEFFLSELEIIMWGYLLDNIVWKNLNRPLQVLVLFSAYSAKLSMNFNKDMAALNSFLKCKYRGFFTGFEKWENEFSNNIYVPLRVFNEYTKKIYSYKVLDVINYNYYVDSILWMAPPNSPDSEIEITFDEFENTERELPELLNLNSVLDSETIMLPTLGNCISQDMMKELDLDA